ncbi:MAG: hypothetical protein JWN88_401 [Frankiales bacterium]|jgi:hypothetical protein|nr:hypothetical protein [Frankiales bacterium]
MGRQSTWSTATGPLVRRWPWALGAAVVGAAAGGAVAAVIRRVAGADAPDAQEPSELQAVVDRPPVSGD